MGAPSGPWMGPPLALHLGPCWARYGFCIYKEYRKCFLKKMKVNAPAESRPQNIDLGTFWFINGQKFQPTGLKMKTFILTRRDLSHYGPQAIRWTCRKSISSRKMQFWDFLFYQKIAFGPIWGSGPKKGSKLDPHGPKGFPLGPKGSPLLPKGPLEAAGAHMGPWGPKGRKKLFFSSSEGPTNIMVTSGKACSYARS